MMRRHAVLGFTLLEVMLVLVIGAGMLVLGFRMYNQYQLIVQAQQVSARVEQLMMVMRGFYQANCRQTLDASGNSLSPGLLDPKVIANGTTLALTINSGTPAGTDLFTLGFLSNGNWYPLSPLVNNAAAGQGYSLQFNRVQPSGTDPAMSVYACAGNQTDPITGDNLGPTGCNVTAASYAQLVSSGTTATLQSSVVFWEAEVSVLLQNSAQVFALQGLLNATCVTTSSTATCETGAITPAGTEPALYLVFEQPASLLTQDISTSFWMSSPVIKQFNMQYTNDGMGSLSGVTSSTSWYNTQNYLCGG